MINLNKFNGGGLTVQNNYMYSILYIKEIHDFRSSFLTSNYTFKQIDYKDAILLVSFTNIKNCKR